MKNVIKVEQWLENEIRFVEVDGEWNAVAKDVTDALGFRMASDALRKTKDKYKGTAQVRTPGGVQEMITLTEKGMYRFIMRSDKPEAEDFQDWVFDVIKSLRESVGLEQYEVFRMMDKQIQKEASRFIHENMDKTDDVSQMKLNAVANKAVSNNFGISPSIKKAEMTPEMLVARQPILNDTAELMVANEKYGLGLSVSKTIYAKHCK